MSTLAVLGAGPKALAIAAKANVLRDLGLGSIDVVLIEQRAVAADWRGTDGWTDGEPLLGTPPEKDIGFPYRSCFGPAVDAALEQQLTSHVVRHAPFDREHWRDII